MYFCMILAVPQCAFICLINSYEKEYKGERKKSVIYRFAKTLNVALLVLCTYMYAMDSYDGSGAIYSSLNGLKMLTSKPLIQEDEGLSVPGVRKTDIDALEWIRDNSSFDSVVLSDKAIISDNPRFYLYGMFCERQQYLEGTDMLVLAGDDIRNEILRRKLLISDVYHNKEGAIEKISNEGVDYIVQTKDITPDFIYDKRRITLVKSTETINVYKVKRRIDMK